MSSLKQVKFEITSIHLTNVNGVQSPSLIRIYFYFFYFKKQINQFQFRYRFLNYSKRINVSIIKELNFDMKKLIFRSYTFKFLTAQVYLWCLNLIYIVVQLFYFILLLSLFNFKVTFLSLGLNFGALQGPRLAFTHIQINKEKYSRRFTTITAFTTHPMHLGHGRDSFYIIQNIIWIF